MKMDAAVSSGGWSLHRCRRRGDTAPGDGGSQIQHRTSPNITCTGRRVRAAPSLSESCSDSKDLTPGDFLSSSCSSSKGNGSCFGSV